MKSFSKMMKEAQALQGKMEATQATLANERFEGVAGGGMVKATFNGNGEILTVSIDPSLFNPQEKEMVEDLLVAALNEAKRKADERSSNAMQAQMGGLLGGLGGGGKLPFSF